MKKNTQFAFAAILAGLGLILLAVDKFSASANTLVSYSQSFSVVTIIGLILTIIAAVWFYFLSIR